MRVLNSLLALAVIVVLGAALFMGWQFYTDCQKSGREIGACIFGDPFGNAGSAVQDAVEDVSSGMQDVGKGVVDVVEDVGDVVEDVGEGVVDVVENVGGGVVDVAEDVGEVVTSKSCKQQFGANAVQHVNGNCYICPEGYELSAIGMADASSPEACSLPGIEQISLATFVGSSQCSPGSILDPRNSGECWTCPTGYARTGFAVTEANACEKLLRVKAMDHGNGTGFFGTDCGAGQFWDPNGNCYSCPAGYTRTVFAVTNSDACEKLDQQPAQFEKPGGLACPSGAFHDPRNGGECWVCPEGFTHSLAPVTADNACSRSNTLNLIPAIDLGVTAN